MENLNNVIGGAAPNGNNETATLNSVEKCTQSLPIDCTIPASRNPNCPTDTDVPTSRTTEGKTNNGIGNSE
ncbi:hypothetical protein [Kordia periserrulae]|nr:hypothetical protein [Kordia periserrulae]